MNAIGKSLGAMSEDEVRAVVRESYGKIARENGSCCGPACCGTSADRLGYSPEQAEAVPEGSNLGLGCGNPLAIASLKPGEVVLDLGSGAGFDCFLAAKTIGPTGKVIGVDMTPDMLSKARRNADKGGYQNVEFRLGEIEHLPVADSSVNVIISNCVINLSPDKGRVIREMFRVLKVGGRIAISDVVAMQPLPADIQNDPSLLPGCMSGATPIEELRRHLEDAGFGQIEIAEKPGSREFIRDWAPGRGVENYLASATIEARKR